MWLDQLQNLLKSAVVSENGCLIWIRARSRSGYGQFRHRGVTYYAHRAAFLLVAGQLARNQVVRHACNNPACLLPAHLSAGTQAQNLQDAAILGRAGRKPRLSNAAVLAIRGSTRSQAELAHQFGITQSMVSKIKAVKTRRVAHVAG